MERSGTSKIKASEIQKKKDPKRGERETERNRSLHPSIGRDEKESRFGCVITEKKRTSSEFAASAVLGAPSTRRPALPPNLIIAFGKSWDRQKQRQGRNAPETISRLPRTVAPARGQRQPTRNKWSNRECSWTNLKAWPSTDHRAFRANLEARTTCPKCCDNVDVVVCVPTDHWRLGSKVATLLLTVHALSNKYFYWWGIWTYSIVTPKFCLGDSSIFFLFS